MRALGAALVLVFGACGDSGGIGATHPDGHLLPDAPVDAPIDAAPDAPPGLPMGAPCGGPDGGPNLACAGNLQCCAPCCRPGAQLTCTVPTSYSTDGGTASGCPLPDLQVNRDLVASTVEFTQESFNIDSCEIMEGCVGGPGARNLVRFSVQTPNLGTDDFALGDPQNNPLFTFSQCHQHYHLRGYARFRILDGQGQTVITGRKQAFCLIDVQRIDTFPGARPNAQFDCGNQGISLGWSDIYSSGLPCQFIDITDVPPGDYQLQVEVNPDRSWPELSYDNNAVSVPIHIAGPPGPTDPCTTSVLGFNRECGWTVGGTFSCNPGDTVTVGCGAACGVGTCTGDTVLRVCAGATTCSGSVALAQNDDCVANAGCSAASFTCTAAGQYTVMWGPYSPGASATCNLAHSP